MVYFQPVWLYVVSQYGDILGINTVRAKFRTLEVLTLKLLYFYSFMHFMQHKKTSLPTLQGFVGNISSEIISKYIEDLLIPL